MATSRSSAGSEQKHMPLQRMKSRATSICLSGRYGVAFESDARSFFVAGLCDVEPGSWGFHSFESSLDDLLCFFKVLRPTSLIETGTFMD